MVGEPRKVTWDKPIPAAEAIDVFRAEANRQVELGVDIVRQVLEIDGLFSEDPKYPGVTRAWLGDLTRTLLAERNKLDTSKNVLNFCMEACWVRRGSACRVVVAV